VGEVEGPAEPRHSLGAGQRGVIFWFDVIAPPALIALYLAT
jgi:hypothetical protein